ncbi:TolB family protein [Paenibacillus ihbetae]|uniref:Uncharacterized protein n=1 Tax=Paenibacillus ihbetae TaxID=1870820 RepID=A0ABX3JY30_9BACL|nr:PD40 domain-containing protein [Paenibacillus ihbetae]OOC61173.1 hypothetical protein BBD40_04255 [Paenibacillus ihbetae]
MNNMEDAIVFTAASESAKYDIWLYRIADGRLFRLTENLGDAYSIPYWSPDTRYVSFIGRNGIVFVLDLQDGDLARIDQIGPYTLLSWSPDSRYLTYVKDSRVVIYDIHLHVGTAFVHEGASDAQWFPSGEALLYAAPDEAGNVQLFRSNVAGTDRVQLTQNNEGPLHNVRISPNGQFALYTSPGASISLITVVNLATSEGHRLEGGPQAKNYFPAWSPDSSLISYSATDLVQNQYVSYIQTDSRNGGQQRTLAVSSCFATPVSWSPDGSRIAYLSGCGEQETASRIWIVNTAASFPPVKIVDAGRITALAWSPPRPVAPPYRLYRNAAYNVSFYYPKNWVQVTDERYEGPEGFFQISAIMSEADIHEVCRSEAFHALRPYGSNPKIIPTVIQFQAACYIFPSADQPPEMGTQSALIVKYPEPVVIQGSAYSYLILWADREHILQLSRTLEFIR